MAYQFGIGSLTTSEDLADLHYISDSQDLESLIYSIPALPDGMTGAFVAIEDGDYVEVWVTESSRPYADSAIYERVI